MHIFTLFLWFCFKDDGYTKNDAYNIVDSEKVVYEEVAKES